MSKAIKVQKTSSIMQKLLDENPQEIKQLRTGDLIEGHILSVSHGEILVDIGAKSEGIISGAELEDSDRSYKDLKPGDEIVAIVLQYENDQGYTVLSFKRAEKDRKWIDVEAAQKSNLPLEAVVIEYNKGGLLVDCLGLRGFVPLSHLDRVHFANDVSKFAAGSEAELKASLKVLAGKTLKVKVLEYDREKNRLVLSEKDALDTYSTQAKQEKLSNIKPEDILEGIVTGIMPFGIFVDLDGVEGLVHISEIAWEKVNHPSAYFKVGQEIKVKVLGLDEDSGKLALSVKRLTENPWETVEQKYPVGSKITGKVSKIVPFGAFINLEKGLDGLVHISETNGPLEEGQEIEAIVTQVSGEQQKLALSIRQIEQK